jgi:TPP-dependent pyruvate/acetoin dehydrogenase alpha subunit
MTSRRKGHWAGQRLTETERTATGDDPLDLFETRMVTQGYATPLSFEEIRQTIAAEIAAAVERAKAAPDPGDAELGLHDVYVR